MWGETEIAGVVQLKDEAQGGLVGMNEEGRLQKQDLLSDAQ